MVRKILVGVFAVAVAGALFAGGASEGEKPAGAAQTFNLRMATVVNRPHPWFDAADYLIKEMSDKTNGAVQIKIFGGGQLGTDQSTFEDMRTGTLDMVVGGATTSAPVVPEIGILNLPYFYKDLDQFRKVMDPKGPVAQKYKEVYAQKNLGVKLLSLGGGGARVFSNNLKDISEPSQLQGIKMRVPKNPEDARIWSSIGAIVTGMGWNEIYPGLQAGVINSFESTFSSFIGSKLYEVAKHVSNTQHIIMVSHLLVSDITWNKLPADYQKILDDASIQVCHIFTDKGEEVDAQYIKELQTQYGCTISEVNRAAFQQAFQPLHDELAAKSGSADILRLMRQIRDGK
jgi:tripartite ATP-independent transporter DctP family solute receptor